MILILSVILWRIYHQGSRRNMTPLVKKVYELYFQCHVGDQDKVWAPHFSCSKCTMNLRAWINGARKYMPFAIPMIWREPKDHSTDCYFCTTNISGLTSKFKSVLPIRISIQRFVQFLIQKNWSFQNLLQTFILILIQSFYTKILCL